MKMSRKLGIIIGVLIIGLIVSVVFFEQIFKKIPEFNLNSTLFALINGNSNFLLVIANFLLIVVNLIVIIFYFLQWRESKRPILYIKFLGYNSVVNTETNVESKPSVLEDCSHGSYLIVSNESKQIATNIKINYVFKFQGEKIPKTEQISYLNPKEATKILVILNEIKNNNKDLFEIIDDGVTKIELPKETMKIDLDVKVSFGYWPLKHSIEDSYYIEWTGLNCLPKALITISSWNKRNNHYVYKL